MNLNPSQQRAVNIFKGPSIILAGPGSGKTAVITSRTLNLINNYHVSPKEILVVTFSRAASEEMKNRFHAMKGSRQVTFGTFHSIFFSILKKECHYNFGNIIDEASKYNIIRTEVEKFSLEYTDEREFFTSILNEISLVKGQMHNIDDFSSDLIPPVTFRKIFQAYNTYLEERNLLDFDDILCKCLELFKNNPKALFYWRSIYKFILIDEFQDINSIQFEVIKLLSAPLNNIFAVGDDDQSIYGFRGASPNSIMAFIREYPDCRKIVLNINYRCKNSILDAALRVISSNTDRYKKNLTSFNQNSTKATFLLRKYENKKEEYKKISDEIIEYRQKGGQLNNIAILLRNNSEIQMIEKALKLNNVAVCSYSKPVSTYSHFIARDIFSYVKISLSLFGLESENFAQASDLFRIINKPSRYISRQSLLCNNAGVNNSVESVYQDEGFKDIPIKTFFDNMISFYSHNKAITSEINILLNRLSFLAGASPFACIKFIRNSIGYDDYLKEYASSHKIPSEELFSLLEEIEEDSKNFSSIYQWIKYAEDESRPYESESKTESASDGVRLMTMHASKGLEFNIVYLPDVNENIIPHKHSVTKEAINEERRLFYVAMTRAKLSLRISYVENIRNKKAAPSEFLDCFL